MLQYALTQQRRLRCTSTPINIEETQKLLSFGNSNSMECAIEFCLDWLEDLASPPAEFLFFTNTADPKIINKNQLESDSMLVDSGNRLSLNKRTVNLPFLHYETPQQQKFFAGNNFGFYSKDLRKNIQGRLYFQKNENKKRLEILDDLFTKKSNLKTNFVYASKLRYFFGKIILIYFIFIFKESLLLRLLLLNTKNIVCKDGAIIVYIMLIKCWIHLNPY